MRKTFSLQTIRIFFQPGALLLIVGVKFNEIEVSVCLNISFIVLPQRQDMQVDTIFEAIRNEWPGSVPRTIQSIQNLCSYISITKRFRDL